MLKTIQIELDKHQRELEKLNKFNANKIIQLISYQINQFENYKIEGARIVSEEKLDMELGIFTIKLLKGIQNPTDDYKLVSLTFMVDEDGYCELETKVGDTGKYLTRLTFTKQQKYMSQIVEDFFRPLILDESDIKSGFLKFEKLADKQ